ncbi:hypothetical protein F4778DRAFT_645119 [Xylariomycetidae sp. FL2044]|nr:hypothetical protein F4778DRAFT_645119 [Xylariomycetidae sp. FL2044]
MMSSNPKAVRSRFSSPMQLSSSPSGHNRAVANEGQSQRQFMQRWLEPPVQNKASFQEAGLMRAGVVENMAPLGTLPKVTMKKSQTSTNDGGTPAPTVKRIVIKQKSTATPTTATTPEGTAAQAGSSASAAAPDTPAAAEEEEMAALEANRVDATSLSPLSRPALELPVAVDDGEDDDYVPKRSKTNRHSSSNNNNHWTRTVNNGNANNEDLTPTSNTRRHSNRRQSAHPSPSPADSAPAAPPQTFQPSQISQPSQTPQPPQPSQPSHLPTSSPSQLPPSTAPRTPVAPVAPIAPFAPTPVGKDLADKVVDKDFADKVVESAVDEALRHCRYPTAFALRELYDDNSSDPHFISMIEDIFHQRADPHTLQQFSNLVTKKKREGKVDNKGCYYFIPPATGSRFTPSKPKPAPYSNLVQMDLNNARQAAAAAAAVADKDEAEINGHISKKVKLDHEPNLHSAHATPTKNGHRKARKSSKSPRKKTQSGAAVDGDDDDQGGDSDSSLSSVPDDFNEFVLDEMGDEMEDSRAIDAEPSDGPDPASSSQPISAQEKKVAPKKKNAPTHSTPSQNIPNLRPSSSRDSSMPTPAVTNGTSSHHRHKPNGSNSAHQFESRYADKDSSNLNELQLRKLGKKTETRKLTKDASSTSHVRDPLGSADEFDEILLVPPPPPHAVEQIRLSKTPALTSRAARAAKRNHEFFDDSISPTTSSFRHELEPPSTRNSRAATPATNTRSTTKTRSGLRVKTSPMKKKGTTAGVPHSGERPSPVGNGFSRDQDDNDDFCFSCGGAGNVVCCDGCRYSFHLDCIDPPVEKGEMNESDPYYCHECHHRQSSAVTDHSGAFGLLQNGLGRTNPQAFRLPADVREAFEAVKTGAEGEYEEIQQPKPKSSKKGGEELFDFFKIKNADGYVTCYDCSKTALENRPIVSCSVCGQHWHLDCLDPPLSIPPVPRTWRCPLHAEELLEQIPARLTPAHRYRKLKNAPPVEQIYSRGMINNGWVEVELEDEIDEYNARAWRETASFGRSFRLKEQGIKADFIGSVHKRRQHERESARKRARLSRASAADLPEVPTKAPMTESLQVLPSLEEQQAALNLAGLSQVGVDGIQQLIQALISQASPAVVSLMALGDATRIASGDLARAEVTSLQTMLGQLDDLKENINKILQGRVVKEPVSSRGALEQRAVNFNDDGSSARHADLVTSSSAKARFTQTPSIIKDPNATQNESGMQLD